MALTDAGKTLAANAVSPTTMSLHTGDPTDDGSALEATGGSPAYARKTIALDTAVNGVRALSTGVTFDLPAGTYSHYALWVTSTCYDTGTLDTSKVLGAQGQVDITSGNLTIT